jgi:inner membrane transporter RhtA
VVQLLTAVAGDLPHRSGTVRLNRAAAPPAPLGPGPAGFSPEAVFVLGGIAQNVGSILAKSIFDEVRPATVAVIRVVFAAVVLLGLSWRQWLPALTGSTPAAGRRWTRAELRTSAVFGIAIALMNLFFFLAIDRLDLGKGAAIEFIGPIAVAAAQTRTRRNAVAVSLAVAGVALLSGLEIGGNPLGLLFIFLASAMWAVYIVIGSRVARQDRGLAGLGIGLVAGAIVIGPFGAAGIGAVVGSPRLLALCCAVGLFTTVIGYGLEQNVLRRIPTERFALLLALLPVNATFIAFIALDERPSGPALVGIALVVGGVVLQQRRDPPHHAEEPAS